MKTLRQLSVFAENKPGKIEKITKALADAGINILAISITTTTEGFGAIKFIVDNSNLALETLKQNGFTATLNEVLGIKLQDKPGGLYFVTHLLTKNNINIENAHVFVDGHREKAYLLVEVEDIEDVKDRLSREGLLFYPE
ncbi:MAG: ACT domain-containing protein [Nitrospirae bacterium]|nr:ACT domain-containing protein [Nitrospirota bacterium]